MSAASLVIPPPRVEQVDLLSAEIERAAGRVTVLTGAGCSTASGIPDYRGPNGTWTKRRPMYFQEFLRSAESRQYFWARNYRGWPRFSSAEPNDGHRALAAMERGGVIGTLITQNVDDLHQHAGQRQIIELHGRSSRVVCLDCRAVIRRADMQERLAELNRDWWARVDAFNPDGDAEIDREETKSFVVPPCATCGGILKPDVIFFGESVAKSVVDQCLAAIDESDALLVIGSSLAIWSGYRFALAARERGKRLLIVNFGETRADGIADLKIDASCVDVLREVTQRLNC